MIFALLFNYQKVNIVRSQRVKIWNDLNIYNMYTCIADVFYNTKQHVNPTFFLTHVNAITITPLFGIPWDYYMVWQLPPLAKSELRLTHCCAEEAGAATNYPFTSLKLQLTPLQICVWMCVCMRMNVYVCVCVWQCLTTVRIIKQWDHAFHGPLQSY